MKQRQSKNIGGGGYLELKKEHKKWFDSEVGMGKQRGKPKAVPAKIEKPKGKFVKHHHK